MSTFGHHIKEARIVKYLSKSELARRAGITPQYITDIETDRIVPSEDKIERLIEALELDEKETFKIADKIPLRVFEKAKENYFNEE